MANSRYALKAGVLLQAFSDASKACTNANLTDELAEYHLRTNPACRKFFAVIPGEVSIPPRISKRSGVKGKKPEIIIPPVTNGVKKGTTKDKLAPKPTQKVAPKKPDRKVTPKSKSSAIKSKT